MVFGTASFLAVTYLSQLESFGSRVHAQPPKGVPAEKSSKSKVKPVELKNGRITFDDLNRTRLKNTPPPIYPEGLEDLDGQEIKIVGFMSPYESLTDMSNFMLMSMPTGCYFCAPPSPKQVVLVRQFNPEKEQLPYIETPIEITGRLNLWKDESVDPEHRMFLYIMDDVKVEEYKYENKQALARLLPQHGGGHMQGVEPITTIMIDVTPEQGRWVLKGTGDFKDVEGIGDARIPRVPEGEYTLSGEPIFGYIAPEDVTKTIKPGQTLNFELTWK